MSTRRIHPIDIPHACLQAVLLDQFQDLGDESHKEETGVGASNPYFSICHVQWVFGKGTRVTGRNSAAR